MQPPTPLTLAFVALVVLVGARLPIGAWRAGDPDQSPRERARWTAFACAALALVLAISGGLAARGTLRDFSSFPPPLIRLVAATAVFTVVLAMTKLGARLAFGLPVATLVTFQAFRVVVEIFLWGLHKQGFIPVQMTFEGRNFDILSGLSALVLGPLLRRGGIPREAVWAWNVAALLLLLNIVTVAVLSMPTRMRVFYSEPPNVLVAEVPFVFLPTILVQAALFGHLLVFRRLMRPGPL
jgi:hypothetical protein